MWDQRDAFFVYTWKALVGESLKSCLWPNWLVGDQPQKI